jgi:hypothetical protein
LDRAATFVELARFAAFLSGFRLIDVSFPRRTLKE